MDIKKESFGDSFFGIALAITILIFIFQGDPDISDVIRIKVCKWAEVECSLPEPPKDES